MSGLVQGSDYAEIRAAAQARADATGQDQGIEVLPAYNRQTRKWDAKSYHTFGLPERGSRYGRDATCEVVSCSDLARCWPGHGPIPMTRGRS